MINILNDIYDEKSNISSSPEKSNDTINLFSLDENYVRKTHPDCEICNVELEPQTIDGNIHYTCLLCGFIGEDVGESTNEESINFNMPLKMTGPKSNTYQKRVISSTTDYKNTQRKVTFDEMKKLTVFADKNSVPQHLVDKAAKDYVTLQKYFIKRGDVRRGIMACLVYEACKNNEIDRTPKEISEMFEITTKELSEGSKLIDKARNNGLLEKGNCYDEKTDKKAKIDRYFSILDIDEKYKTFVSTLIDFICQKRKSSIHSGMKARCAGAIFILVECLDLDINRQTIAEKCDISIATFIRFSNIVKSIFNEQEDNLVRKKLSHLFKKHEIPIIEFTF